jgi:hypothetical protein
MAPRPTEKKPSDNTLGGFIVFAIIVFIIFKVVTWSSNLERANAEADYEGKAFTAMVEECKKNCAAYGVTQESLIGPKVEYRFHTKYRDDYIFSWHSNNPSVILTIETDSTRSPPFTTVKWSRN